MAKLNAAGEGGRPLRAAVIGVGYLGRFHAQKYAAIPGVELVAVVDANPARAAEVGNALGVPHFTDYRGVLNQVDLVSIVVPTVSHYRIAGNCLEAGVHVLVEKPITTTVEEADELIDLAENNGLVLQVGHLKRFHPAVSALKNSGILTTPLFIESHRLAPFKSRALDVDVVLDLMIHDVDLILNFVASPVVSVQAVGAPVVSGKVDLANARLTFANGCIANVTASRIAAEPVRAIRLFQEDAYIKLNFITKSIQVQRRVPGTMVLDGVEVPALESSDLPITDYDTLQAEIAAFCDAVRHGTPPLVSGRDGRKALAVVNTIRQEISVFASRLNGRHGAAGA